MKKSHNICLLIAVLLGLQLNHLNAQVKFSMRHISLASDTVNFNTIDTLNLVVKNTGTASYTGMLNIYYQTDSSKMPVRVLLDSTKLTNLAPGDSTFLPSMLFMVKPNQFDKFNNIIVIWPTGSGIVGDPGTTTIYVRDTLAGVNELQRADNGFSIYPNPTRSTIYIRSIDQKYSVETVRIYNSIGSLIRVVKESTTKLDVNSLSQGLYLLEIETNDNRRIIKRIIRE